MNRACPPPDAASLPATAFFGGRPAVMRFLRPDDADRLLRFFATHTPETIRSRYGYSLKRLPPERAAELVGVNQQWDAALGVFEGSGAAEQLIAVARCCRLTAARSAEIAFVVREDRRRLGIARSLFRCLAGLMRKRGVDRLVAQVDKANEPMLALFRSGGARLTPIPGTTAVLASLGLGPPRG
ncbi:MAG TPA: GNAT family N-acetyltransferase [Opitutaceae bacterium]|nr:GNAT family N-acetyltransferase [Opitutaceae bacterium]